MDFIAGKMLDIVFPVPVGAWTNMFFFSSIVLYTDTANSLCPFRYSLKGNSSSFMDLSLVFDQLNVKFAQSMYFFIRPMKNSCISAMLYSDPNSTRLTSSH